MAILLLESAGHRFVSQWYALCRLFVTYRLWQLHERKVSEPEQGTFRDFLNDRNGWRNATLIAVTSKQY